MLDLFNGGEIKLASSRQHYIPDESPSIPVLVNRFEEFRIYENVSFDAWTAVGVDGQFYDYL